MSSNENQFPPVPPDRDFHDYVWVLETAWNLNPDIKQRIEQVRALLHKEQIPADVVTAVAVLTTAVLLLEQIREAFGAKDRSKCAADEKVFEIPIPPNAIRH